MSGETAEDGAQSSEQTGSASGAGCCEALPAVDEKLLVADVQLLSALGNDTRYELVRRIGAAEGDVCVCDLEAAVGLSQSAVSQALSRLYSAGLVSRRKDGSWRYYELTADAEQLLETLDTIRTNDE
ncbi:ArsR/SmtB family transcription factor [Halorientalis pallida]|uniref:ArsR family transcriptional regulator n=1 Tax=Halorientalis pallida TaxID=2479928 RepID=A0A498L023_9EURY|nr:metalloregulator ArsR/SmtB family transcription factor [Halorientalis pallida]RXK47853.1 ArsR family transcriptional regulator [Halorientalis pallida]